MIELSLFTGCGGGIYGGKLLGWTTVGYVENDKYCCRVIEQRIRDGIFDDAPVFEGDIRAFIARGYAAAYTGMVDVITGGPPCQGFSVAGKGLGKEDSRNMVPAMLDVVEIVQPTFVWIENSSSRQFRQYYHDYIEPRLRAMGYCSSYGVVSAQDAIWLNSYPRVPAAFHERKRTWILAVAIAHAESLGFNAGIHKSIGGRQEREGFKPMLQAANADLPGREEQCGAVSEGPEYSSTECSGWWSTEPRLDRLVHGTPNRVNRIKSGGNAQVPAVVALAWRLLSD